MLVAGPNAEKDYHYNETGIIGLSIKGYLTVFIHREWRKKLMELGPGDILFTPCKIPIRP